MHAFPVWREETDHGRGIRKKDPVIMQESRSLRWGTKHPEKY